MQDWGPWDWIGYICMGLTAIVIASHQFIKEYPLFRKNVPTFMLSQGWLYVPVILFVIGSASFGYKLTSTPSRAVIAEPEITASARPLAHLSNAQLKDSALEFAKKMREFEVNIDSRSPIHSKTRDEDFSVWTKKIDDFSIRKMASFSNEFLGQARTIKSEISYRLRRFGIFPPYFDGESTEEDIAKNVFANGFLAGPFPVTSAANLLERMARLLPDR